jgi:hypothetical protein
MRKASQVIGVIGADTRQLIGHMDRESEMVSMWLWRKEEQRKEQH